MNCYNHHQVVAVAQCQDCRKGLCNSCAKQYSIPICEACNLERGSSEKTSILIELALTFGVGFVSSFFLMKELNLSWGTSKIVFMLIGFYSYSGVVAGWKTLNRITPRVFLFLPIIGWLIYLIVKLIISFYVGLVMLPVRTVRNIKRLIKINKL